MGGADNKLQEDELVVFVVEQVGTFAGSKKNMLALKPGFGIALQTATQAVGIDPLAPSLAEFFEARAANEFS